VPRPRKILTALAVAGAWACVASAPAWASCPGTTTQASGLSQAQLDDSITCLINEQRAAYGLAPVQSSGTLQEAAQSHSAEMVSDGYFAHTSPSGVTFIDRIEATGYMRGARSWLVGENLAWGTSSLSSPGAVVQAWMNSPPHRENLLRAKFRELGVAAVRGTPDSAGDANGITVASEYGYRGRGKSRKVRLRRRHR
jgi:uncharacterized protein YkwD